MMEVAVGETRGTRERAAALADYLQPLTESIGWPRRYIPQHVEQL